MKHSRTIMCVYQFVLVYFFENELHSYSELRILNIINLINFVEVYHCFHYVTLISVKYFFC